jgi:small subunit ribosomal protein S6
MRHYEIVFLVHPDQSEQVPAMLERYENLVKSQHGLIHRKEDCGRKPLAYPINNAHKAHFLLLNIECEPQTINELKELFKFNDAIIRSLFIQKKKAVTHESPLMRKEREVRE